MVFGAEFELEGVHEGDKVLWPRVRASVWGLYVFGKKGEGAHLSGFCDPLSGLVPVCVRVRVGLLSIRAFGVVGVAAGVGVVWRGRVAVVFYGGGHADL